MKKNSGVSYLWMGLTAFLGIGMEAVLVVLEQMIYKYGPDQYTTGQTILHWGLTCIIWGSFVWQLYRQSKKSGFDFMSQRNPINAKRLLLVCILALAGIIEMTISWGGFKPGIEWNRLGWLKFIFQYIYYFFETALYLLIIVFGQKFGEEVFQQKQIPYGSILLAMTWGMIHIASKGLTDGIEMCVFSLLFGAIYVLLNRNVKMTYLFLAFIFII